MMLLSKVIESILLSMCDLWLKTYGLKGKDQVDQVLLFLASLKKGVNSVHTFEEGGESDESH